MGQQLRPRIPSAPRPDSLLMRRPRLQGTETPAKTTAERVQAPMVFRAPTALLHRGIQDPLAGEACLHSLAGSLCSWDEETAFAEVAHDLHF